MILVSYRARGSDAAWRAGIADGQGVIDASAFSSNSGDLSAGQGHVSVRGLLERGPQVLEALLSWAGQRFAAGRDVLSLATLELGPPVPDPDKIICLGVNYRDHAAEAGMDVLPVPIFFAKFRNCLTGPTSPILLPRISTSVDYEGELAVVIGSRCKAVAAREALRYVAGYTIMNDVSARDLQMQTSQWIAGKALDSFAPMGPGIVLASEIGDPQTLTLITRVNGRELQHDSTAHMIFSVAAAIEFLSSLMTLEPGDIIATGTPAGVGFKRTPPIFLRDGDVVEVEIERLGSIRNPVTNSPT